MLESHPSVGRPSNCIYSWSNYSGIGVISEGARRVPNNEINGKADGVMNTLCRYAEAMSSAGIGL